MADFHEPSGLQSMAISVRVKIPPTIRKLFRDVQTVIDQPVDWLLLSPDLAASPTLWTLAGKDPFECSNNSLREVVSSIPVENALAGPESLWQRSLITLLFPGSAPNGYRVVSITAGSRIVACVGWSPEESVVPAKAMGSEQLPILGRMVGSAIDLEILRSECEALHWVVQRSDRPVVAARSDGRIYDATPSAIDILKALKFGPRHRCRKDAPELPSILRETIARSSLRQCKLNDRTTALIELIRAPDAWGAPTVGIELLVEPMKVASSIDPALSRLTSTERDILEMMLTRATNRQISHQRGTRYATVKNQVSTILAKLGVQNRRELFVPVKLPSSVLVSGSCFIYR